MKLVWIYIGLCSVVFAEAFQEGQALVSGKATVGSVASTGIVFSENPAEAQYTDNAKISAAVEDEKRTNEAYQQIKHANAERKSYQISLSIPYQNRTTKALEDTLGNTHVETSTSHNSVRKTCFKSGESYTKTCKQQRMIEIKVTPQVTSYKSRYCHGHWVNKVTGSKRHCNPGCQGGEAYISQAKKVDITRDELVGCEDLEKLRDQGKAEIISETLGAKNESRVIEGETITKDYWETTRTYALNTETFNECDSLQAIGCRYEDSVCDEYIDDMAGARVCKRYKMSYVCSLSSETKTAHRPDLGVMLPPTQTAVANHNMTKALSQMEGMRQMAKHMEGTEANLRIFRGESKRCTTNFGGSFKDCCKKDGGTGTKLKMATECTAEEKNLVEARLQKRCVFVGARQKNKTLGMNVSKEYVYCCFSNKLGLAIQQGARAQLRRTFGSAESPVCDGLTPDELSVVDFERLDLSETFADITASAQKATREVQRDLAQKQQQFQKPDELASIKANQHKHKRVYTDQSEGGSDEITY